MPERPNGIGLGVSWYFEQECDEIRIPIGLVPTQVRILSSAFFLIGFINKNKILVYMPSGVLREQLRKDLSDKLQEVEASAQDKGELTIHLNRFVNELVPQLNNQYQKLMQSSEMKGKSFKSVVWEETRTILKESGYGEGKVGPEYFYAKTF